MQVPILSPTREPATRPYEVIKRERDAMSSRLLLLYLQRHHYELAPKEIKDRHLPVLYKSPWVKAGPSVHRKAASSPQVLVPPVSRHNFDTFVVKPGTQLRTILVTVAHYYRVRECDILGERRTLELVIPRHVCLYLASILSDASIARIGNFFRRDHTVISYAKRAINGRILTDSTLALQIDTIRKQIAALDCMPAVDHVARLRERASQLFYAGRGRRFAP
jgi:hypothetical protein